MQSIKVKKERARPFLEAPEEILSHSLPVFSLQTALSFHFYPPFHPFTSAVFLSLATKFTIPMEIL